MREQTPLPIKTRLFQESLKDTKLNFCTVKTLLHKEDREEVAAIDRWEKGSNQLPSVVYGNLQRSSSLAAVGIMSPVIKSRKQFIPKEHRYLSSDPFESDPRLIQKETNRQLYIKQFYEE